MVRSAPAADAPALADRADAIRGAVGSLGPRMSPLPILDEVFLPENALAALAGEGGAITAFLEDADRSLALRRPPRTSL